MNARAGRRQPRIAFVGNEDDGSCFGDGEVRAADAHIGQSEFLAQQAPPRLARANCGSSGSFSPICFDRAASDALTRVMHRRSDEMGGTFSGQLDDELAEVRLVTSTPAASNAGLR